MDSIFLVYFFLIFLFLFSLYAYSRDDYLLLRKGVAIETLYNISLSALVAGFLFARLAYVVLYFKPHFLNPLNFFLLLSYPGLSLTGGLIGVIAYIIIASRSKNLPTGRLIDIFLLSFFSTLPFFYIFQILKIEKVFLSIYLLVPVLHIIFWIMLFKIFKKGAVKEGSIAVLVLFAFSVGTIFLSFLEKMKAMKFYILSEDIVVFLILLASLVFVIQKEKLLGESLKNKK